MCVCVFKDGQFNIKTNIFENSRDTPAGVTVAFLYLLILTFHSEENILNKNSFSALNPKHLKSSKSQVKIAFTSLSQPLQIQRRISHPNRVIKAFTNHQSSAQMHCG